MLKCIQCGKSINLISYIYRGHRVKRCDECLAKNERDKEARALNDRNDARVRMHEETKELIASRLASGKPVFIYESIYIPVDSKIKEEALIPSFDIGPLKRLGLTGWEIVQVVPKTTGIALQNKHMPILSSSRKRYGGGIGGNVAGVYVLLKKEITQATLEENPDELKSFMFTYVDWLERSKLDLR